MTSIYSDLQWCPLAYEDFLLNADLEVQLYQVKSKVDNEHLAWPNLIQLNKTSVGQLIATNTEGSYIKCTAWCHGLLSSPTCKLFAVGQANGKIAITSFNKAADLLKIHGKEYVPKHSRAVNSLAWNTIDTQYLVAGLDRFSKDNSLLVFDVTKPDQPQSSSIYDSQRGSNSSDCSMRPVVEYGNGEAINSVVFSRSCPTVIFASFNGKQIRMFDMRDNMKQSSIVYSKAVKGLCCDEFNPNRIASFIDNQVFIWDIRSFDRPAVTFTEAKPIIKLGWSPTRQNCLASLCYDSSVVRLHELQNLGQSTTNGEQEVVLCSRSVTTDNSNVPLLSFSWHPKDDNRMLLLMKNERIMDTILHERVTLNWGIRGLLTWTSGKKNLNEINLNQTSLSKIDDISSTILKRAEKKYGLYTEDLSKNGEVTNNQALKNVWSWLEQARGFSLSGKFRIPGGSFYKFNGVVSILDSKCHKSEVVNNHWIESMASKLSYMRAYRSEERNLALQLCSWCSDNENGSVKLCEQLESAGEISRAVAVCVFNLRLKQAITILNRAADQYDNSSYNTIAMALSGFTDQRKGLWRETCTKLQNKFKDSYLRATFSFLTNYGENYDAVLNEPEITIQDKVGFACLYLNDVNLHDYLEKLQVQLLQRGDLDAILLTGLSLDGVELLQRYLDLTGDVQTPALIAIHGIQHTTIKDERLEAWIENYRNLLDNLRLWNERAKLDCITYKNTKTKDKPRQQVYISCNFCSKSISSDIQTPGRTKNPYARYGTGATNKSRMCACPNCKRPLPRCSLCLQHMGTPSERTMGAIKSLPIEDSHNDVSLSGSPSTLTAFSTWFTWCQTCRHGGHAHHVMEWFQEHTECPVTSCDCTCMSIDPVGKASAVVSKLSI